MEEVEFKPQPGPQEQFLASPADIAIYGGAAGGGKTHGLLLEVLRHSHVKGFGAVIFRREAVQIQNEGGLWDSALEMYPLVGAEPRSSYPLGFTFPSSVKLTLAHLNKETSVLGWQGAQIPLIGFDELTHFSEFQFFYMLSRNRSVCGVKPYVRATTNPDANSWVRRLIDWWIGPNGNPIPERSGVLRYFVRRDDQLIYGNSIGEVVDKTNVDPEEVKSLTFIPAKVTDNQILMGKDPAYMANLKALSRVERGRLLDGNWNIKPAAGMYFARHEVNIIDAVPSNAVHWVRSWDLAASEPTTESPDPDYTAGVKIGITADKRVVVAHAERFRKKAHEVRKSIKNTAAQDGKKTKITIPQDPGQAGKEQAQTYVVMLMGYPVNKRPTTKDKISRAEPFAAQWQAGNVDIVKGPWNEAYLAEMEQFPSPDSHDDQVDASSDAFATLPTGQNVPTTAQVPI